MRAPASAYQRMGHETDEGTRLTRLLGASLVLAVALGMLGMLVWAAVAVGKASHEGWPKIDGMLLMNKHDQSRPLSGRPDAHNELLGGHGSDEIVAGRAGDV